MKYEVIKGCVIHGSGHQPGAVVDLDERTANILMGIGRVVPADESKAVNRSVGLKKSEEAPRVRARTTSNPVMAADEEDDAG